MADSREVVRQLESELKDRFGKLVPEVRTLLQVTDIRVLAEQKGILSVESESNRLKCLRGSGQRDDWVMIASRFPRLTAPRPHLRLKEIIVFLNHLPNP
jgi:transcription-repair coupling factor (superfamily II helicase)